ncbi:MAG: hypothetical protein WAO61_06665 [Solirubrobacterales bacterium]
MTAASMFAVTLLALAGLAGCGGSVDGTLVKEAGVHGDRLEKVYALYTKDVLAKLSSRDLKDIDAALAANDLKRATPGDLRRAQDSIRSRIARLEAYQSELKAANDQLKRTPKPNFNGGLDEDFANGEFAKAYASATGSVERYTTADLGAVKHAFSSLEKYLDFLEQWEEFVADNDTSGLVSAGEASDQALKRLRTTGRRIDRRGSLSGKIKPLVDRMASAASDSAQLTTLIDDLKKRYPKSFLAIHVVEEK